MSVLVFVRLGESSRRINPASLANNSLVRKVDGCDAVCEQRVRRCIQVQLHVVQLNYLFIIVDQILKVRVLFYKL